MGGSQSYPGLTEDVLEDYRSLTYLNKGEILHLMKKFYSINPEKLKADYKHRFTREEILQKFDVLKNNPFQDRIFQVFSSQNDNCFSFEDMLDLCSAMSAECPAHVKASWAFRVFDLNDDNQLSASDIKGILDRLTWHPSNPNNYLDRESKTKIANVILDEINLDNSGAIGMSEFKLIMSRIPEFASAFYFRL
ncbi:calcium and integrin-binding protein 1 [Manduca sexta]|uniref:calcium and integrin-binding protein 1 n=1 Tax=Manduca sexta TaxID=7130 RepID=UPI00188E1B98|nr:calcium and integrin-binding protein 1 [Manduca sexta]